MTGEYLPSPSTLLRLLVATTTGVLFTAFLFHPYISISSTPTLVTEYPVLFHGRRIKPSPPVIGLDTRERSTGTAPPETSLSVALTQTDGVIQALSVQTVTETITSAPVETAAAASSTLQLSLPEEARHDSEFFLKHNVVSRREPFCPKLATDLMSGVLQYPASWRDTFNSPSVRRTAYINLSYICSCSNAQQCIVDYAKRTGLLDAEAPLRDWDANYAKNSSCPVFPIPEGGFLFHMHWEGEQTLSGRWYRATKLM